MPPVRLEDTILSESNLNRKIADFDYEQAGKALTMFDSVADRISSSYKAMSRNIVPAVLDAFDSTEVAKIEAELGNSTIYDAFRPIDKLDNVEERDGFISNLESKLEGQRDQFVVNRLKGKLANKPPDRLEPFFMESSYIPGPEGTVGLTLDLKGRYSPNNVFVDKNANALDKAITYIHEDDHVRFPRTTNLINPSMNINPQSGIDPRYHGQETEVSARLAELEGMYNMIETDSMMELKTRKNRMRTLEELEPFIEGYKKIYPEDKRVKYFDKWKGSIRHRR